MANSEKQEKAVPLLELNNDPGQAEIIEGTIPEIRSLTSGHSTYTSYLLESADGICFEIKPFSCNEFEVSLSEEIITTNPSTTSKTEAAETFGGVGIGISAGLKELSKITGPYPKGAKIMSKKSNKSSTSCSTNFPDFREEKTAIEKWRK